MEGDVNAQALFEIPTYPSSKRSDDHVKVLMNVYTHDSRCQSYIKSAAQPPRYPQKCLTKRNQVLTDDQAKCNPSYSLTLLLLRPLLRIHTRPKVKPTHRHIGRRQSRRVERTSIRARNRHSSISLLARRRRDMILHILKPGARRDGRTCR